MDISIFPYTPHMATNDEQVLLEHHWQGADDICRRDKITGEIYIDGSAIAEFVHRPGNGALAPTWQQIAGSLPAGVLRDAPNHGDARLSWHEVLIEKAPHPLFFSANQQSWLGPVTDKGAAWVGLMHQDFTDPEQAWDAMKNVVVDPLLDPISAADVAASLQEIGSRLVSPGPTAVAETGTGQFIETPELYMEDIAPSVGGCFEAAGLVWIIIFFVVFVAWIVSVVVSGGMTALIVAVVIQALWAAGIWATITSVITLVICLCNTLHANCEVSV